MRTIRTAAQELSFGVLRPSVQDIVSKRKAVNKNVGEAATLDTLKQEEMLSHLRTFGPYEIAAYLDRESVGEMGQALLTKYLIQILPQFGVNPSRPTQELATELLSNPRNRAVRALVRNDMYQTWDFARRNRTDFRPCVPDDSYHVANASYCQVFVTEDRDGQTEAAKHAMPDLEVLIYPREQAGLARWLLQSLDPFIAEQRLRPIAPVLPDPDPSDCKAQ